MSSPTHSEMSEPPEGRYRIGAVASLTGISAHALRVWERRYQTVCPARTPGGDRLYSERDVARLQLIKRLLERGHTISELAALEKAELLALLERHAAPARTTDAPEPRPGLLDVRQAFMEALATMEFEKAERVLSRAAVSLDPRSLVFDIVVPILHEVGDRWERGELRIAHEHAASVILRNLLGALIRTFSSDEKAPGIVVSAPAEEVHEFGALLAAMIAVSHGWRVTYLGPNLPAAEIAHVVEVRGAQFLLLSLVLSGEPSREAELRRLNELLAPETRIIVGGHAAGEASAWLPRARQISSLEGLERFLKQQQDQIGPRPL
ncbi:MAG: MerR family transcriptional regulator [Chrysiogenetes bacterium]|nr:MerR family transcriptional regulator [Chrysiogenetes bacterium]